MEDDNTVIIFSLLALVVCCCCSSSSFLVTGGLLLTKKDDEDEDEDEDEDDPSQSQISGIPHQIMSGTDGWCINDGKTVHQDVPGCGRICSSWEYVGRKDKGTWGPWGDNQNGIDCPDAKLDQVWKLTGGLTDGRPNRELAVGTLSSQG